MSLIRASALALPLIDGCVQCCVTSPPYWGLRDYGHAGQIGLEATPEAYVANLVQAFAEVWRVLKSDGVLWLNLGDSYASNNTPARLTARPSVNGRGEPQIAVADDCRGREDLEICHGLKVKDLVGIPWMAAFALRAAGWYLRSDIIWSKPNPMPESVTDRPTKAHEYIFLLTKNARYYYDAAAIKEVASWTRDNNPDWQTQRAATNASKGAGNRNAADGGFTGWNSEDGRNKRSVWTVNTQPYPGAHFATFPEALIEPCILAGSRPGDLILDPFCGTGTVGQCSERLMRRWVGTDLSYQGLAKRRTRQRGLRLSEATA